MTKGVNPSTGMSYRFKDRTGQRNGRLVFLRTLGEDIHRHHVWEARCDCGNLTQTATPGKTRSCGCIQRETASKIQLAKALSEEVRKERRKLGAAKFRVKRRADPLLAMQARLSRLHRHALAQVNAIKTSPTFEKLGYTVEDFVTHIERQFLPGMGWANMSDWQIDHIVPISEARTADDVVALNQLSNLRPMWSKANNSKRNKREHLV